MGELNRTSSDKDRGRFRTHGVEELEMVRNGRYRAFLHAFGYLLHTHIIVMDNCSGKLAT